MFWFIFYKSRVKHWLTSCAFLLSCPSKPYLMSYILHSFSSSHDFFLLHIFSLSRQITTGKFEEVDQRWRNKTFFLKGKGGGGAGFRSVIWCSRFDLRLKFIIKSVSITAGLAAGYQGQPNALLMRHSETHIHTQTHTCCSHYVQIGDLQPPCPALP